MKEAGRRLEIIRRCVRVAYDDTANIHSVADYCSARRRRIIDDEYLKLRSLRLADGSSLRDAAVVGLAALGHHERVRRQLSTNADERLAFHNARISLENLVDALATDDDLEDIRRYVELYEDELSRCDRFRFEAQPIEVAAIAPPTDRATEIFDEGRGRIRYMTQKDRDACRVVVDDQTRLLVLEATGRALNVAHAKYVLSDDGLLYVAHLDAWNQRCRCGAHYSSFFHPSFLPKGRAVRAAGRLTAKDGLLFQFDNSSSHFCPPLPTLTRFFFYLYDDLRAQLRFPLVITYYPPGTSRARQFALETPLQSTECLALDAGNRLVRAPSYKNKNSNVPL